MTIKTGLTSITFRKLSPAQIVSLVARAGLAGIEWGGDVHAPHGDTKTAAEVAKMTREAGLEVASYGSYYHVGESPAEGLPFSAVLDAAAALGARMIRVWAGKKGSSTADEPYREKVRLDTMAAAESAAKAGIAVSFEYHGNTLTDTKESALRLMKEVNHPNLRMYWQPPWQMDVALRCADLEAVLPYVTNLHVFAWRLVKDSLTRFPLSEGCGEWIEYFQVAHSSPQDRYALLEFVKDDSPEQFAHDAKTLTSMLNNAELAPTQR